MQSYFITDRKRLSHPDQFFQVLERVIKAGVEMIQIREKDLPAGRLEEVVNGALTFAVGRGTKILVNDRLDVALACGAAGCHLPAAGLPAKLVRQVSPPGFLVGASVHSPREAMAAEENGADFLVFGPVFRTTSKPKAAPLGVDVLAEVTRAVGIPVFALGGISAERVKKVAAAGAAGVAGISVFMNEESLRELTAVLASSRKSRSC